MSPPSMTVSLEEHTASPYRFMAMQRYTSVSSPVSLVICGEAKGRGVGLALSPPLSLDVALNEGHRGLALCLESWCCSSGDTAPGKLRPQGSVDVPAWARGRGSCLSGASGAECPLCHAFQAV